MSNVSEYLIQQKYLGQAARTVVKSPDGTPKFLLVGSWGQKGNLISIYSMDGKLLAFVKRVPWTFGFRFDLYQDFKRVGTMQRLLHFRRDFYFVPQINWQVYGDILAHHYVIHHFTRPVLTMTKVTFATGDCYILDIPDETEAPLAICVASVLDYWLYNHDQQSSFTPNLSLEW